MDGNISHIFKRIGAYNDILKNRQLTFSSLVSLKKKKTHWTTLEDSKKSTHCFGNW